MNRAKERTGVVLRDKWRLDRLLGVGGMAAVYSATHRNGKRAAVKVLHPEAQLVPSVRSRFVREGYLANKVEHPGAVSIVDDDVDEDGTVFLVMELLDGETLESRLERSGGRLELEDLLQIIDKVLDCLSHAHARGIVHRDLKPGNLFVTTSGDVKLLDFGIACLNAGNRDGHTTEAQALGTPGFMPPEQARGRWEEVDAQSDLWALGSVMFAAITGRFVHEAPTLNEQLLAAMTEPAAPVREFRSDVAEEVALVVDRALEFDKGLRWQDAASMRDAIRDAYRSIAGCSLSEAPRLVAPPLRSQPVDLMAPTVGPVEQVSRDDPTTTSRPVERRAKSGTAPAWAAKLALPLASVVLLAGAYLTVQWHSLDKVDPSKPAVTIASRAPGVAMTRLIPFEEAVRLSPVKPANERPSTHFTKASAPIDEPISDEAPERPKVAGTRSSSKPSRSVSRAAPIRPAANEELTLKDRDETEIDIFARRK